MARPAVALLLRRSRLRCRRCCSWCQSAGHRRSRKHRQHAGSFHRRPGASGEAAHRQQVPIAHILTNRRTNRDSRICRAACRLSESWKGSPASAPTTPLNEIVDDVIAYFRDKRKHARPRAVTAALREVALPLGLSAEVFRESGLRAHSGEITRRDFAQRAMSTYTLKNQVAGADLWFG